MNSSNPENKCPDCGAELSQNSLWCSDCSFDLRTKSQLAVTPPSRKGLKWKEIKSVRWKDADGMVRKFRNYPLGIFSLILSFILVSVMGGVPIPLGNAGAACGAFIFMIVILGIYLFVGFLNLVSYDVHTWRHKDEDKILGLLIGGAFLLRTSHSHVLVAQVEGKAISTKHIQEDNRQRKLEN